MMSKGKGKEEEAEIDRRREKREDLSQRFSRDSASGFKGFESGVIVVLGSRRANACGFIVKKERVPPPSRFRFRLT